MTKYSNGTYVRVIDAASEHFNRNVRVVTQRTNGDVTGDVYSSNDDRGVVLERVTLRDDQVAPSLVVTISIRRVALDSSGYSMHSARNPVPGGIYYGLGLPLFSYGIRCPELSIDGAGDFRCRYARGEGGTQSKIQIRQHFEKEVLAKLGLDIPAYAIVRYTN